MFTQISEIDTVDSVADEEPTPSQNPDFVDEPDNFDSEEEDYYNF